MKKLLIITLLLTAGLLTQCKKTSDFVVVPDPGTEVAQLTKAGDFLKMLTVTGAEKVVFDSVTNNYYVSLPDSYNESEAEIKLSLQKNIVLWDSAVTSITKDSVIRYNYNGTSPLLFKLSDNPEKSWFYFTVYFNFPGTPKIELLSKEIPLDSRGSNLPLRFLPKIGSIPSSPGEYGLIVKVINRKTGYIAESYLYPKNNYVYFYEAEKLITNDPLSLEISMQNQKPVVFEGIKFTRSIPKLYVAPDYKFVYTPKDTIKANGGFFVPAAKYSATFTSDYIPAPVTVGVKFIDAFNLAIDEIPYSLSEGSYVISFYEDNKLLEKNALYVAPSNTNCIESIWKGNISLVLVRNVSPLSFTRGDTFFAKLVPMTFGHGSVTEINAKLSVIRLKNDQRAVDLKPELVIYDWAIAGKTYAVGKYTIPTDVATGTYEVTAVSPDKKETRPYWSKLQVR